MRILKKEKSWKKIYRKAIKYKLKLSSKQRKNNNVIKGEINSLISMLTTLRRWSQWFQGINHTSYTFSNSCASYAVTSYTLPGQILVGRLWNTFFVHWIIDNLSKRNQDCLCYPFCQRDNFPKPKPVKSV